MPIPAFLDSGLLLIVWVTETSGDMTGTLLRRASCIHFGYLGSGMTGNDMALDSPPPGAGVNTVISKVDSAATSASVS